MRHDRHDILEAAFPGQASRFFLPMSIGGTPEQAHAGAASILQGIKTATSSPFWDYPDGRLPFVGALSVLLDGRGQPVGIVQTVGVETIRFCDVNETMAKAYGEGDRTLAWWRRNIGGWYRDKAALEGQAFAEQDQIVWEWISVVGRS